MMTNRTNNNSTTNIPFYEKRWELAPSASSINKRSTDNDHVFFSTAASALSYCTPVPTVFEKQAYYTQQPNNVRPSLLSPYTRDNSHIVTDRLSDLNLIQDMSTASHNLTIRPLPSPERPALHVSTHDESTMYTPNAEKSNILKYINESESRNSTSTFPGVENTLLMAAGPSYSDISLLSTSFSTPSLIQVSTIESPNSQTSLVSSPTVQSMVSAKSDDGDAEPESSPPLSAMTECNELQCKVCFVVFKSKRALAAHNARHATRQEHEKPYECVVCQRTFRRASDLKRHSKTVHKKLSLQCGHCGKVFSRLDTFKRHQKQHND